MTYVSNGLVQAADLNSFIGSSIANVSGELNTVWSTGNGNAGYGQTAAANVSAGGLIIASTGGPPAPAQFADLINKLNIIRQHQTGSTSGITVPVSTDLIQFYSTLSTQLTSAYTSRLTAALNGTTITGTNNTWNPTAAATVALDATRTATITFGSADNARYFFNAGGKINYIVSAVDNAATARSQSVRDIVNNMGGITNFAAYTNSGRSGTGGSISTNNTAIGYWNNVGTTTVLVQADDAAPYTGYYSRIQTTRTDATTTNGANGLAFSLATRIVASADDAFGGAINITVTSRVDIVPPSTVYLSNTWGTPTISYA